MAIISKPKFSEVSAKTNEFLGSFVGEMLTNEDEILQHLGGDLEVYKQVARDDQVKATFQQRRDAVIARELIVEPGGSGAKEKAAADFIREQIQTVNFDDAVNKMLWGVFYGYSVAECMWGSDGRFITLDEIKVRERHRFGFDKKGQLHKLDRANPRGLLMPDRKFWTFKSGGDHSDNPYGLGLAHHLYWLTYFKRNGLKFWMIFLEKFGAPTVTAKANRQIIDDPFEKDRLLNALQAIQVDGAVIIPEGVEIELLEAVRGGTSDYDTLQDRMNSAISKIILSQTMTTDDGSSRSQSETHKLVRDEVVESDAWLVDDSFNKSVVKWLTEWNFGEGVRPPIVTHARKEEENLTQQAEIDTKVYQLGFEPTEEYIKQTYGDGWVKRVAAPMPQFAEFADAGGLGVKQALHRSDMGTLVGNAKALAQNYDEAVGDRVRQLMALLDETKDYATFEKHLIELMETAPSDTSVKTIEKANFVSRLFGALRGQR